MTWTNSHKLKIMELARRNLAESARGNMVKELRRCGLERNVTNFQQHLLFPLRLIAFK